MIITKLRTLVTLIIAVAFSLGAHAGGSHSEGGDDHGHADEPRLVFTDYTETTELFVEFPPLVVNQPSKFAAHVTRLSDFEPLTSGVMDVTLVREEKVHARFRVQAPARKGIFQPTVIPKQPGDYELRVEVRDGELHAVHHLGKVSVFANNESVEIVQKPVDGEITYLKEQQWENAFASERIEFRALRASVPGFGTVMAPADGSAVVRAASDGYFTATELINAGDKITANQLLGYLVPRLGDSEDIGKLLVEFERAKSGFALAQQDADRLTILFEQGAVPERRLLEARQALALAEVEMQSAQSRAQQYQGTSQSGIAVRAPIAAEVIAARVRPGAFVAAGDELFSLAVPERRWLSVQIPEKFTAELRDISGVWLQIESATDGVGLDTQNGARLLGVNSAIDSVSRTATAIFEYPSVSGPRFIGARFPTRVFYGKPNSFVAIPRSAVIDDGGQPVVYVQTGGETFERRSVRLGIHDGLWVQVLRGVLEGERLVSQGAYFVKLAATSGDTIGHGHAH